MSINSTLDSLSLPKYNMLQVYHCMTFVTTVQCVSKAILLYHIHHYTMKNPKSAIRFFHADFQGKKGTHPTVMDKRKEANNRVKKAITDATFDLLRTMPLSDITITSIIQKAGVARVSFYRNYSSKEEVLVRLVRDILDDFRDNADYNISDIYSRHHVHRTLSYFYEYRSYVLNLVNSGYSTMLLSELNAFHESIAGDMSFHSTERYKIYIYMGALCNMVFHWLRSDEPEPIDDMVDVLLANLSNTK